MRLVYYSLANFPDDSREYQWIQSIRSLRRYNRSIPVWLILFNGASCDLLGEAERQRVHVRSLGDYQEFLQGLHPRGAVLALYPTLHKFLAVANLPLQPLSQLLYLDCDTFFFDDVNLLFDRHSKHDWYAREEYGSRRSHVGYDSRHIDEALLKSLMRKEKLRYVPPFNSGVCLLNHHLWRRFSRLGDTYLSFVWRLLCGRELSGHQSKSHNQRIRQAVIAQASDSDQRLALPYPSENHWIIEQIALWLTLGSLSDLSLGTLSRAQVAQGSEFETKVKPRSRCVLAHYFSGLEREFFQRVTPIGT